MSFAIDHSVISITQLWWRRGPLQIAISTAGHSGALAQRLRKQMESQFGPEWERWLRWLGEARSSLYEDAISPKRRRTMLHRLASQKKQAEFFDRWGSQSMVASKLKNRSQTELPSLIDQDNLV